MAQDKKKKGKDLMLPTPEMSGDPMLAGTGQPGELANTPTTVDSTFAQEKAMEEQGIEQDPMLKGTGQPGELYGAPKKPSVVDEAKKEAELITGMNLKGMTWLRAINSGFEVNPYSPSIIARKIMEEKV